MAKLDIAIIGCGPAGLSAAINAKVRGKNVRVFGTRLCSPALHKAHRVDNYLGVQKVAGEELRQRFLNHASSMGIVPDQQSVTAIYPMSGYFEIQLRQENVQALAVILATGVAIARPLPGEEDFIGRGISYCATCDGNLYRGKRVAVVADNAGGEEEALFLAGLASAVLYLPQYGMERNLGDGIKIVEGNPAAFLGSSKLEKIKLKSGDELAVDGCFIHKEQVPLTQIVPGLSLADRHIQVDRHMATNLPGLFAAGDVTGRPYQLAKAVGEGQMAALNAVSFIDGSK